jgi:hypothetical protein
MRRTKKTGPAVYCRTLQMIIESRRTSLKSLIFYSSSLKSAIGCFFIVILLHFASSCIAISWPGSRPNLSSQYRGKCKVGSLAFPLRNTFLVIVSALGLVTGSTTVMSGRILYSGSSSWSAKANCGPILKSVFLKSSSLICSCCCCFCSCCSSVVNLLCI